MNCDLCRERCNGRLSLTRYILAALMKINAKQSNSLTTAAVVSKPAIQLPSASTMTALPAHDDYTVHDDCIAPALSNLQTLCRARERMSEHSAA